ncbi:nuclear transport factor 2 family protein [Sphaerimonospora sp. CA-214678]|uniref:nuclear transport factor 2 family protein n=1 Tax=Sphaerimonospora sp. CA-214678 TaxID=3240029 RepID=UPI003D9287CF
MEDRAAIIDTICRFAFCLDRLAWTDFEGILAGDVRLNTIRTGGWVSLERHAIVGILSQAFGTYTATQHISANHQVELDGDAAVVWSTLNATHYRRGAPGGEFQQQVGYYEYTLARRGAWRITSVRQHPHWQTGNQAIFDSTVDPA